MRRPYKIIYTHIPTDRTVRRVVRKVVRGCQNAEGKEVLGEPRRGTSLKEVKTLGSDYRMTKRVKKGVNTAVFCQSVSETFVSVSHTCRQFQTFRVIKRRDIFLWSKVLWFFIDSLIYNTNSDVFLCSIIHGCPKVGQIPLCRHLMVATVGEKASGKFILSARFD